jgi:hypothetical protein
VLQNDSSFFYRECLLLLTRHQLRLPKSPVLVPWLTDCLLEASDAIREDYFSVLLSRGEMDNEEERKKKKKLTKAIIEEERNRNRPPVLLHALVPVLLLSCSMPSLSLSLSLWLLLFFCYEAST